MTIFLRLRRWFAPPKMTWAYGSTVYNGAWADTWTGALWSEEGTLLWRHRLQWIDATEWTA